MRYSHPISCALIFTAVVACAFTSGRNPVSAADEATQQERHFESKIRPLLVTHCIACHGPEKAEAGLRLDHRSGAMKGSDYGKAIIAGKPEESRLHEVLLYDENDLQMPPKGPLAKTDVQLIENWIKSGAFWPEDQPADLKTQPDPRSHWAWQPVRTVVPPNVSNRSRVQSPIDRFIQKRLEAEGLELSPEADRRTLIRRLSIQLHGMPPSMTEVERFINDQRPDAWPRLVDQYLSSPRYGERWGRFWLDVARYADTKGYVFQEERRYPYAYTYRNYVIDAFNADLPFDQFIREQLAADQLGLPERSESLAATGFLTVGRRFRNATPDIIDDRIDVVSRGLMGITMACARCHDHKYDPIPTADYYSLYGVFNSSTEPAELPLIGAEPSSEGYRQFREERSKLQSQLDAVTDVEVAKTIDRFRTHTRDHLVKVVTLDHKPNGVAEPRLVGEAPKGAIINRWRQYLKREVTNDHHVFGPWKRLASLRANTFEAEAKGVLSSLPDETFHPAIVAALKSRPLKSMYDVADVYGSTLANAHTQFQQEIAEAKKAKTAIPERSSDTGREQLRLELYGPGKPFDIPTDELRRYVDRASRNRIQAKEQALDKFVAGHNHAPPRAMLIVDKPNPGDARIFLRGDNRRPGDIVRRRFPQILSSVREKPFESGSGRLELADAIASADNPLTPRVIANRIWMHHFGKGIVRTVDDFGVRSDPPTHPELLDWMASKLIRNGWSLKNLHREILLSGTWKQTSTSQAAAATVDPENFLLWRQNSRRLDFEAMRDSMIQVAGHLTDTPDAKPLAHTHGESKSRRTVYLLVDRNNMPGLFRTFDFANPDQTTGQRPETTVPQQTLFALNSPFVIELSRRLAERSRPVQMGGRNELVRRLYNAVYQRDPTSEEIALAKSFLETSQPEKGMSTGALLAQVLLLSNEFWFVD